jgi:spermidine synthase
MGLHLTSLRPSLDEESGWRSCPGSAIAPKLTFARRIAVRSSRSVRRALAGLLLIWGAASVITQSILLRETTVLFLAGEICWGIVLFAWLCGVAIGAWFGGVVVRRATRTDGLLGLVVILFAIAGPVDLLLLRYARGWLGVGAGEYMTLGQMTWLSAGLVSPFGLLIGAAFPLACAAATAQDEAARLGWVYWVESLGSLFGGMLFTFLLAGRASATFVMGASATALISGAGLWLLIAPEPSRTGRHERHERSLRAEGHDTVLPPSRPFTRRWGVGIVAIAAILTSCLLGMSGRLENWSVQQRWRSFARGLDLRATTDSRYQNLALGWREGQYSLYENGHPTATFPDPIASRWSVQVSMCEHPRPRRVLLLGGGADGVLAEILTHTCVERVDFVQLDPAALTMIRPELPLRDQRALADPRVGVIHEDIRRYVQRASGPYDVVICRFGPPNSAMVARFYSLEFYRQLTRVMSPDGIVALQTECSPAELRPESAEFARTVYWTLKDVFDEVIFGWGAKPLVLACRRSNVLTTEVGQLAGRLAGRGVADAHFAPADFELSDDLSGPLVAKRRLDLESLGPRPPSTDLHPRIYLIWLQRWEQQTRERASRGLRESGARPFGDAGFQRVAVVRLSDVAAAVLLAPLLWLLYRWRRWGRSRGLGTGVVLGSMASTGFVSMAAELVLLFAYQSLNGYAYEQIGAVIGLFMFGLVIGSSLMNQAVTKGIHSRRLLAFVDLSLAAVVALLPAIITVAGQAGREWPVSAVVGALVLTVGAMGGAAFPLAGALHGMLDARANRSAAALDASDHAGASLGALLTGVILVPAIGMVPTCLALAGLKVLSAAGLVLYRERDKSEG